MSKRIGSTTGSKPMRSDFLNRARPHSASVSLNALTGTLFPDTCREITTATAARQKEMPMKIIVPGKTPMERLSNLTKRIIAVPKDEVEREEQKWRKRRANPGQRIRRSR